MCCKLSLAEGWRPSTTTSPFAKAKGEKSPSPLSPALSCRKSQTPIGVVHRGMVPQCCQLEQVQLEPRAIVQRKRPPPPQCKNRFPQFFLFAKTHNNINKNTFRDLIHIRALWKVHRCTIHHCNICNCQPIIMESVLNIQLVVVKGRGGQFSILSPC